MKKKALAATQAGCPCIGVTGCWNWGVKDDDGERRLNQDLADIDWEGLVVWICPDLDDVRNADVMQGFCELAKLLHSKGATVKFVSMPIVERDVGGKPKKCGLDDFLVARGEGALRGLVESSIREPESITVDEYRQRMAEARLNPQPGTCYLDRSNTGLGKTYADIQLAAADRESLFVSPSHKQSREIVTTMSSLGMNAAVYPMLGEVINKETGERNCQNYNEAKAAMEAGYSPRRTICIADTRQTVGCPFRKDCCYLKDVERTGKADHAAATGARAVHTLTSMSKGKELISLQEDPLDYLCPILSAKGGFGSVFSLAKSVLERHYPHETTNMADLQGQSYLPLLQHNAKILHGAVIEKSAGNLISKMRGGKAPWQLPSILYRSAKLYRQNVHKTALQICLAATDGHLREIMSTGEHIIAMRHVHIPEKASLFIGDATLPSDVLAKVIPQKVVDITPPEKVDRKHKVTQYWQRDINGGTSPDVILDTVRWLMLQNPKRRKFGLITFKKIAHCFDPENFELDEDAEPQPILEGYLRDRIAMVDCFFGATTRGSNEWHEQCDHLIVIGTPRPPKIQVQERLMQISRSDAIGRDGLWMTKFSDNQKKIENPSKQRAAYWSGVTESEKRITVKTGEYADHDWHDAQQSIARAELIQCGEGRARSSLDEGIDCSIVATMECGATLSDDPAQKVSGAEFAVLKLAAGFVDPFKDF